MSQMRMACNRFTLPVYRLSRFFPATGHRPLGYLLKLSRSCARNMLMDGTNKKIYIC
jgi:hypothetical protein